MSSPFLERALFVIGRQGDGKSSQIRDIFRDRRLHNNGKSRIGEKGSLRDWVALSNERHLHIRVTSPHEYGDDVETFFDKIERKSHSASRYRWNFLCALQASAFNKMPDPENVVSHFMKKFEPERTRVLLLYRNYNGTLIDSSVLTRIQDGLDQTCEFYLIDGRRDNGLLIADFFDFT
ncbi:hypothetical protein GJ654_06090 [Rhodoblastus acidophilus]|uniref:Uncharacterized protein n=1 Tax=Rhodoblastus acidophilus TaxID=1074 RepID=A0A6N8DMX3_RHOAC|nr:hypothetical protein [Rhodoblastus acidophilus]MCW2273350.1 hypothetical protein [Rhodoblastus acidophilus]MTV30563.1 hypothetical protein [Rhodoblastus acidophilus]